MNVKLYTRGPDYSSYRTHVVQTDKLVSAPEKAAGNYDKVTIHKTQASGSSDTGFARMLAKTLDDKLDEGEGQSEVLRLQSMVASGTYQPDARRIAERMLCYR